MAAAKTRVGNSGIFWMNGVSDEEQPLAFVPGVDGDLMPGSSSLSTKRGIKMRSRRSTDYKNEATPKKASKTQDHIQPGRSQSFSKRKVSAHHDTTAATDHKISPALDSFLPLSQVLSEANRARSQVCLKDLCAEDKRRIANLIEELARVSEEKEESMQRLKDEQERFEHKIQQLEEQNVIIAQERENVTKRCNRMATIFNGIKVTSLHVLLQSMSTGGSVVLGLQQQYKECQELLGLYQQYLSQQQAKLNQSIAQLSQAPAHSKVLSSEEVPSRTSIRRTNGSLFDGSYLGLAATQAQQPQVPRSADGGKGAVQTCSNAVSLSSASVLSSTHGQTKQHRSHKRECRELYSESCHRCERCQGSGQNSVYGTQQWRSVNSSHLENGHHDTFNKCECERQQSVNAMTEQTLTRPLLGHEDWEEKRHQLLLQKMQLEMERERLQARLIEQEERLNRQNQQLHQTHLDYSRFQQATQAELSNSNTRTGDPQPEGPSHRDLPSSVHKDAEIHPTEQHLHEKCLHSVPGPRDDDVQRHEALEQSRRDMATSPAKSPASLSKPTSLSTIQKTPDARLDFSLVELLDMLSPVSAPVQSELSTQRAKMKQRRPALATLKSGGRTLLTPAGPCPQSTQQDLEESQILEDIFFIC